jgi:hypothetical protein
MRTTSMSRYQTLNSAPRGQRLPARKVLAPIQAVCYSSIAKRAEDFGPSNSKPAKRSGGPRILVAATCRDAVPPSPPPSPPFQGLCSRADSTGVGTRAGRASADCALRAYFAENGKIAWDMDTKGDYQAVNGVAAKGGSIDGGGAVVVDGMVYVGSGSGFVGTAPGNVLLAYSIDGL